MTTTSARDAQTEMIICDGCTARIPEEEANRASCGLGGQDGDLLCDNCYDNYGRSHAGCPECDSDYYYEMAKEMDYWRDDD